MLNTWWIRTKGTIVLEEAARRAPIFMRPLFSFYYDEMIDREIDLGAVQATDRVLFIGGGPYPYSAMRIAEQTGASVDIVDNDATAVEKGGRVIASHPLADRMTMKRGDGATSDASSYDVVFIARQAQPHVDIMERIWQTAGRGTRVIVRQEHVFQQLTSKFTNYVQVTFRNGERAETSRFANNSLLFVK